jgi:hypothetical protein
MHAVRGDAEDDKVFKVLGYIGVTVGGTRHRPPPMAVSTASYAVEIQSNSVHLTL